MTARVNLLPRELEERIRARRVTTWSGLGVAVFVVMLGLVFLVKTGQVEQARLDRDDAQSEVARLETRLAQLEEFRLLNARLEARNRLLASAMEREISWSRVLNDMSLAFPANSSLRTLNAEAVAAPAPGTAAPASNEEAASAAVASVTFDGYTVEEYSPGVEAVLLEFDKVRAFYNAYLNTAAQEDISDTEVTNFSGAVRLDQEAYTRRYESGLPPEFAP